MPTIRPSIDDDVPAIAAIYSREVLHGVASFELIPPSEDEMIARRARVIAAGMPYLSAELDGRVVGYAYSGIYRARPAYRFTVENSVYVAEGAQGAGIGRALLGRLIEETERAGARQMIAVIATAAGTTIGSGSIRLHRAFGFEHAGTLRASGWKHGRWLDTVRMQRSLGPGGLTAPE